MVEILAVASVRHAEEFASLIEIVCSYQQEVRLSEWPFDDDELRSSYLEVLSEDINSASELEYNQLEPNACLDNARRHLIEGALEIIQDRAKTLGVNYPLDLSKSGKHIVSLLPNLNACSQSYLWLRAYILIHSKSDYFQFESQKVETKKFEKKFEKVFEFLSAFAALGHFNECEVWHTASSRSVKKYFLPLLDEIAKKTHHKCTIKKYDELTPKNKAANEGGVDAIAMTKPNGDFCTTSELYLLQATIQKTALSSKVVNANTFKLFDNFFADQIKYPKKGILAVPAEYSDINEENCANAENLYFHRDEILKSIGKAAPADDVNGIADDYLKHECHWPPKDDIFQLTTI